MSLGAVFSTANFLQTSPEIQSQVQDSDPALILTTADLAPKLDGLIPRPPILIDQFLASLFIDRNAPLEFPGVSPADPAVLMYSSGTTGKSKGVVTSHGNLVAMASVLRHVWGREEVYACVVPLSHMFGFSVFVCGAVAAGATVVVLRRYALDELLMAVEEHRVTLLPAVPPMVVQLARSCGVARAYDLRSLKEVICSGAPLGRDHMERFADAYPGITLSQCYGLTETSGPVTVCHGLTGYLKNREATSLAIDEEGWLHTGDLCYIDTQGLVYIVDRIKELIKYKAYQVAPAELEEVLSTHPEILDVAVTPYPDEEAGEIPMACVVRKAGSKIKGEDIVSFMEKKVAPYKKIRKVLFVEIIPRSPSGKILRRHLKATCYGLTETSGPVTVCHGLTGYLKNREATSLAIDEEGWLHTGDLCYIDTQGLVYIVDRIKELIKYKAYQVAPAELEEVLSTHPEILDVAVTPYPDEEAGEIPMACVVRKAGSKIKGEDIVSFMEKKVAPYKKIRKVLFVEIIPRSPSGKILRRHLKATVRRGKPGISARL
ncbi:hypothetical protein COCNU_08G011220 [Cocos nucifera]|uniref:4-coumarate--CoA ligase n=1 Tax=Cocos nucifera TaxID=13894 RepID=A0A8K0IK58_COCNU|nr:hypothetical protein COCNU_08G011220 [Cocos nucifera]